MLGNELKIRITAEDEASAKLDNVGKKAKEAGGTVSKEFKEANKELRTFRQNALLIGLSVGAIIGVTKEWAKHNKETRDSFKEISENVKLATKTIGSFFAPAIVASAEVVKLSVKAIVWYFDWLKEIYQNVFGSITRAMQYQVAFYSALKGGVGVFEAHRIATEVAEEAVNALGASFKSAMTENLPDIDAAKDKLKELSDAQKELDLLFQAGKVSFGDYAAAINDLSGEQAAMQSRLNMLAFYKEESLLAHRTISDFAVTSARAIQTGLSGSLTAIITQTKSAKEAFAEFGKMMLTTIVDFIVQKVIASAMEKVMLATHVAATSAAAAATASAWATPAALVSLASFGANAGPASAGIASTVGLANALALARPMAEGGIVTRPTHALIGEAGPEAVIPLEKSGNIMGDTNITIVIEGGINPGGRSVEEMAEELGFLTESGLRNARGF